MEEKREQKGFKTHVLLPIIFILTTIGGIALKIYIRKHLVIPLEYSFDEESQANYENLKKRWLQLSTSKSLWQMISSAKVFDKKQNAGADNLVERKKITISESSPIYFKSNIKFVSLNLSTEKIYLMPDKILIEKGLKIGAASYEDIEIVCKDYRFIEDESVPKDAIIIGHTWLKTEHLINASKEIVKYLFVNMVL